MIVDRLPVFVIKYRKTSKGGNSMPGKIAELLFPPKCVCCREILPNVPNCKSGEDVLCRDCRVKFEAEKYKRCSQCGKQHFECECMPPILALSECYTLIHVCPYDGTLLSPVTRIVFTLKKKANGSCESFAAKQLALRLREYLDENSDCDFCITYIPRRRRAIIKFGHDHSELLASRVAELCGLEFLKLIKNNGRGKEQKSLDTKERIKNVSGMLTASKDIGKAKGKNVILIDDIATSGASLAAGTSLLTDSGAASVTCLCFAVTDKRKKNKKYTSNIVADLPIV